MLKTPNSTWTIMLASIFAIASTTLLTPPAFAASLLNRSSAGSLVHVGRAATARSMVRRLSVRRSVRIRKSPALQRALSNRLARSRAAASALRRSVARRLSVRPAARIRNRNSSSTLARALSRPTSSARVARRPAGRIRGMDSLKRKLAEKIVTHAPPRNIRTKQTGPKPDNMTKHDLTLTTRDPAQNIRDQIVGAGDKDGGITARIVTTVAQEANTTLRTNSSDDPTVVTSAVQQANTSVSGSNDTNARSSGSNSPLPYALAIGGKQPLHGYRKTAAQEAP
jgi:hypothetical protein